MMEEVAKIAELRDQYDLDCEIEWIRRLKENDLLTQSELHAVLWRSRDIMRCNYGRIGGKLIDSPWNAEDGNVAVREIEAFRRGLDEFHHSLERLRGNDDHDADFVGRMSDLLESASAMMDLIREDLDAIILEVEEAEAKRIKGRMADVKKGVVALLRFDEGEPHPTWRRIDADETDSVAWQVFKGSGDPARRTRFRRDGKQMDTLQDDAREALRELLRFADTMDAAERFEPHPTREGLLRTRCRECGDRTAVNPWLVYKFWLDGPKRLLCDSCWEVETYGYMP